MNGKVGNPNPRWEWRIFAASLDDLVRRIPESSAEQHDSDEIYFLRDRDDLNLKVRNGMLDLKCLVETDLNGLQQWKPLDKVGFPASAEAINGLLAPFGLGWSVVDPATLETFLTLMSDQAKFKVLKIRKSRRSFSWNDCQTEITKIRAMGKSIQTFCMECESAETLLAGLKELKLSPSANVSLPTFLLKWAAGLPPGACCLEA